jgi:hypothetical protein
MFFVKKDPNKHKRAKVFDEYEKSLHKSNQKASALSALIDEMKSKEEKYGH